MATLRRASWLLLLAWVVTAPAGRAGEPSNLQAVGQSLVTFFSPAYYLAPLKEALSFFQLAFTAVGWAAVMVFTVRRVMKARGGEESLGWVSGLVMTVAFMVLAPEVGQRLYSACDELAAASGYSGTDSIKSSWNALLVVLPNESPAHQMIDAQSVDPKTPPPSKKMTQKVLIWNLFAEGWNNIRETFASVFAALTTVANRILVFLMLLVPSVVLLLGVLLTGIAGLVRELTRVSMDVFLPMMVAMLSFAPMRGAANSFILRYVSVALWPIAWSLWNKLSLSLLVCTMQWVVQISYTVLKEVPQMQTYASSDPSILAVQPGYFAAASLLLPWNLQIFLCLMIAFVSAMLAVGTVAAPVAITKTITHGASFVQDQLRQTLQAAATLATAAAAPGIGAAAAGATAVAGGGAISGMAMRASGSLSGMASQMSMIAAAGGPMAPIAALGGGLLARTANMMNALSSASDDSGGSPTPPSSPVASLPTILGSVGSEAQGQPLSLQAGEGRGKGSVSPRSFRRRV